MSRWDSNPKSQDRLAVNPSLRPHDHSDRTMDVFFSFGATIPIGPGHPHSWGFYITHNDAPHSIGLLWMSDQPDVRPLPDNTQHSLQTDNHAPGGIRTHNLSRRAAEHPSFRPRGQSIGQWICDLKFNLFGSKWWTTVSACYNIVTIL